MKKAPQSETKVDLQMTPMIDVVFQLLIYFMLTYQPKLTETSFLVRLPPPNVQAQMEQQRNGTDDPPMIPELQVHIQANAQGGMARISIGGQNVSTYGEMQRKLESALGATRIAKNDKEGIRVLIVPDENLHYEEVVTAMLTAAKAGVPTLNLSPPPAK